MIQRLGLNIMIVMMLNTIAYASNANSKNGDIDTVVLKPKVRASKMVGAANTISMEVLRPFIRTSIIFEDKKPFLKAPYVIAEDENRIESGQRSMLYVRGIQNSEEVTYGIYRAGKIYKHPVTGEKLGFEALNIGTAELSTIGDPAEFNVVTATEGIEVGARLLPSFAASLPNTLTILPAKSLTEEGFILAIRDGMNQAGRNQIVVISLGHRDGLVEGNTLNIMQSGKKVVDPYSKGWRKSFVQLPDKRIGALLVFQTYEKLSLGLILEATEIVNLLDKVKSP